VRELLEILRLFPQLLTLGRALVQGDLGRAFGAYEDCERVAAARARQGTAAGAAAYTAGKLAGRK
jgi:hypothetical protein